MVVGRGRSPHQCSGPAEPALNATALAFLPFDSVLCGLLRHRLQLIELMTALATVMAPGHGDVIRNVFAEVGVASRVVLLATEVKRVPGLAD